MPIRSNFTEVKQGVSGLGSMLKLRRRPPGFRKTLGETIVERSAEAIIHRSLGEQTDPSGRPWKRLSARYLRWKMKHGYSLLKNEMTGEMLSLEQVRGKVVISDDAAQMTAGTDDFVQDKVEWTEEGQPEKNRPKRPFYDLGAAGEKALDEVIGEAIDNTLRTP
jgi:hypothetical protein